MLQRNDTGYAAHVMAWPSERYPKDWPFVVGAGEEKDFHDLLGGFSVVADASLVLTVGDVVPQVQDAAAAADKEEGEPQ